MYLAHLQLQFVGDLHSCLFYHHKVSDWES